jgi:imidazolonepropionase-like amidohydrolase
VAVLAIRVAQVFDGRRVVAGAGVVFVEDGRIAGIESARADIPDGCRLLDRPGATVLPGLIDAHVHLLADSGPGALDRLADFAPEDCDRVIEDNLRVSLSCGVTSVRDLGDRNYGCCGGPRRCCAGSAARGAWSGEYAARESGGTQLGRAAAGGATRSEP